MMKSQACSVLLQFVSNHQNSPLSSQSDHVAATASHIALRFFMTSNLTVGGLNSLQFNFRFDG
ncbi:unnamed protein product [Eruca vesicaria subsp. sativa]|uniref:Uncharacterized protein n=1 Tax=Eruca vesicaria subsp. sativa TaxID=29727 RepID=A0ABC8M489_ERUVS|nr:unnamed protein product [Eruca vesicaria subsp. sativa]